jgi:hypothetical protein
MMRDCRTNAYRSSPERRPRSSELTAAHSWREGSLPFIACLLAVAVPAIQPLITRQFTCGYDNVFHMWRSVQMGESLRHGYLLAQWAPDMAHGYGLPLFIFNSPLTPYLAALFNMLGLAWPLALNLVFGLGMLGGVLGMFLLGQELFGRAGGIVSAVAYLYAPFQAYDVYNRGSLSEAFAWTFPPIILWALHRWIHERQRRFLALTALGLAGLVLTHNLFGFLFAPILVAWVLVEAVVTRDGRLIARGVVAGALGLGLATFFWLPGLAERGWVQTDRLLGTWVFDYRYNYLDLRQLLAPPRVVDPTIINDWPPKGIGLLPALLALGSLAAWRRLGRAGRWHVITLLTGAVGFAVLTLPVSLPVWNHLPLLVYVQFPWRYLGPAAFCTALLAGATLTDCRRWPASALAVVFVLVLVLGNLGWFYPDHCPPPGDTSVADMIAWEQATDTLGATAKGEYLPIWVQRMPRAPLLGSDTAQAGPAARLLPGDLPEGAQIHQANYGPVNARIDLESPVAFRARYQVFYYPGWHARVDGAAVPITPTEPEGLISFGIPAGRHTITVRFGDTPVRRWAKIASLLSLGALIGGVVLDRGSTGWRRLAAFIRQVRSRVPALAVGIAVLTVAFCVALATDLSPYLRGPQDWRWVYAAPSRPRRLWISALALVTYLTVAWVWVRSARGSRSLLSSRALLLGALVLCVPLLQLALLAVEHDNPLRPLFYRTVSAGASGVFSVGSIINDPVDFLRKYPTLMPTFPVHPQRYPPGLALIFYGARRVFEGVPNLADTIGFPLRRYQCQDLVLMRLPNATLATAAVQMALPLVAAFALLPLYGLARRLYDRQTAAWVVALYPLVPSFALWSARWEQFYPLLTVTTWYFYYVGLTRMRPLALLAAGLTLSVGTLLNFSLLTLLAPLGLFTALWLVGHRRDLQRSWRNLVGGGVAFIIGLVSLWAIYQAAFGTGFFDIWRVSMGYHLGLDRDYWTWLGYHLVDFLVFLGLPLAILLVVAAVRAVRDLPHAQPDIFIISIVAGLVLLDLSGTSRGEVARVWLFLTPVAALVAVRGLVRTAPGISPVSLLLVGGLLAAQLFTSSTFLRVVTTGLTDPPPRAVAFEPPSAYTPRTARLGESIMLLGYDLAGDEVEPGGTLHLTLYWQALSPVERAYTVATHLVGSQGEMAGQRDNMPANDALPTTCWIPGEVVADHYAIPVKEGVPAGPYRLESGMYLLDTGERLPAVGPSANQHNLVQLAEIAVAEP